MLAAQACGRNTRQVIQKINLGGADSSAAIISLTAPQLAAGLQDADGSLCFDLRGRPKAPATSDLGGPFCVFEYTESAANTGLKYNIPGGTDIINYVRGVDAQILCGFTRNNITCWNAGDTFVWSYWIRKKSAYGPGVLGWRCLDNSCTLDGFFNGAGANTFSRPEYIPWQPTTAYVAGNIRRRLTTATNDHDPWIAVCLGGGTGNSGAADPFANPVQNGIIAESTGLQWRLMTDASNGLSLGTITAFAIGGELANTHRFGVLWDSITFYGWGRTERMKRATLVQITDSIGATNGNMIPMQSQILTQAQAQARVDPTEPCFVTLGRAGFKWQQGQTVLRNSTYYQNQDPRVKAVSMQIDINNIIAADAEAPIVAGDQSIVNDIAATMPAAKFMSMQILPWRGFAGWFAGGQAVWDVVNPDLRGTGGIPITGVNVHYCAPIAALSDGLVPPSLPAPMTSGDGLHPSILGVQNNAGQAGSAAAAAGQGLQPELVAAGVPLSSYNT